MQKILPLIFCLCWILPAHADTENFCGRYIEENNMGFLIIPAEDTGIGSKFCSHSRFQNALENGGTTRLYLKFAKKEYKYDKWHKFSNHLIEVRAKIHNGYLSNVRFVRDRGL